MALRLLPAVCPTAAGCSHGSASITTSTAGAYYQIHFSDQWKLVKNPKGGELTLQATFGDTIPKVCGDTACADFEGNQVGSRLFEPVFGGHFAEVSVLAALVIDNDGAAGSNGLVWEKKGTTDSKFEDRLTAGNESKRIRLDNSGTYIHFGGGVKMNAQTSSTSNTCWWLFGLIFIENVYLTECSVRSPNG